MTKAELFEEIRTLLRDPLTNVGATQVYDDDALIPQIRSAIRHLSARGLTIAPTLTLDGELSEEFSNQTGVLIALRAASSLLRGDMVQRVIAGDFGVVFQQGNDLIDTKTAAIQFKAVAQSYEDEFSSLLVVALSVSDDDVLGGPNAPGRLN